jgi:hypothetical protein
MTVNAIVLKFIKLTARMASLKLDFKKSDALLPFFVCDQTKFQNVTQRTEHTVTYFLSLVLT